jgi:hypothetical protein
MSATGSGSSASSTPLLVRLRAPLLLVVALAMIVALAVHAPIAQDLAYHRFADARTLLGIPNFWNVASNLPFVIVGAFGLFALPRRLHAIEPALKSAYLVLFLGVALVGFGSGYYHWSPNNETLVWDRLPMTLAFMAFFAIILGEHVSLSLARWLLWPLLAFGVGSVLYWQASERAGHGDLRPYILVQFLPMLLIPLILLLYPRPGRGAIWLALAAYVAAKLFEQFDAQVYAALGGISGHSLKHLAAAAGMAALLAGLRAPISRPMPSA